MKYYCLMIGKARSTWGPISLCLTVLGSIAGSAVAASFEPDTVTFQAGNLVDKSILRGPNHTLRNKVINKGYMNNYVIDSPFGEFSVIGDWAAVNMVHEIDAIAELKKMSKTGVLAQSAAEAAQKPVNAAKQLVEQPAETVKGIPAGVGRLFSRAADVVGEAAQKTSEAAKSEGGDGSSTTDATTDAGTELAKGYLGVGAAHRKLARELEVDPYSTNKVLQAELASMARYAAAGSFGTKLIMPSIPGASVVANVNDMVWNLNARDLKLRNEKSLAAIGADKALIERFIENPHYTPTDQTRVVSSLEALAGTKGRAIAVDKAAAAKTRQEALVYARMTAMLASYHQGRSPIIQITDTGRLLPLATSKAGPKVLAAPVDHVSWTRSTADSVSAFAKVAGNQAGGRELELWVQGSVSATARKELGALGWTVFDRAFMRLEKEAKK